MNEHQILAWIGRLTQEKDRLRRNHQGRPSSHRDSTLLQEVESAVDGAWDLVRQRRARRAAGKDWGDLTERAEQMMRAYHRAGTSR